jgi:hypothetical protein
MAKSEKQYLAFNRGLISDLALARLDIDRVNLSAETYTNFMPRKLGSMMFRPGTKYLGNTASNNKARLIPFIFSTTDTALLEVSNSLLRVWVSDSLITRPTVTASLTNGTFNSDLTGWDDKDGGSAVSQWLTGGYMELLGDGTNYAAREQAFSVIEPSTVHALSIVVERGPVVLRVGSTSGGAEVISERVLGTGSHSLAFTPNVARVYVRLQNKLVRKVLVDSCTIEGAGTMTVTAPWAQADLDFLRFAQSADVVYLASGKSTDAIGYQQYKILRWDSASFSVVKYEPEDGPFLTINTSTTTITPNSLTGDVTLTASDNLFQSGHVGALFRLGSQGQSVSSDISAQNTFTSTIKVTGVDNGRVFTYTVSSVGSNTVTVQRSLESADAGFTDVIPSITADGTISYDDTLDNQTAWYRIGIKTGDYVGGTTTVSLNYPNGSITGIVRITTVTNGTTAAGIVLSALGGTAATVDWYEGEWSGVNGYPTSVAFSGGRLYWGGRARIWASESDAFETFDDTNVGDSGTFRRTIGFGPVDQINWMTEIESLLMGTDGSEIALRSSNDDEVVTPLNANLKIFGTQGSANVQAEKLDNSALFVQRGDIRLMLLTLDVNKYGVTDLTTLNPNIGSPGFIKLAVQRQPDTRIHCVRSDGTVAMLVYDPVEEISCWVNIQIGDGFAERNFVELGDVTYQNTSLVLTGHQGSTGSVGSNPLRMYVSPDGVYLYVSDAGSQLANEVHQYEMSSIFNISTATYTGRFVDVAAVHTPYNIDSIFFKTDGTRMYTAENNSFSNAQEIHEWELADPWLVDTATYTGNSFDIYTALSNIVATNFYIDDSGTRMYITDVGADDLYQFSMDAWDITSLTLVGSININSITTGPRAVYVSGDGLAAYVLDGITDKVLQFDMSTAWDITTAVYAGPDRVMDASVEATAPPDMHIDNRTGIVYVLDSINETIFQYSDGNPVPYNLQGLDTAPAIEEVTVLPGAAGTGEDSVYYQIARVVNGTPVRFIEKLSLESENQGGTVNKSLDAHVTGQVKDGIMTGLSHLKFSEVLVWVNGVAAGTYQVNNSGNITGVTTDGDAVAGLKYTAQWKSSKLGLLTKEKNIRSLGVIMRNSHYQSLSYGQSFDDLDPLPLVEDGGVLADNTVHATYDNDPFPFPGSWDTDSRLCLQCESPYPCTILAAIIDVES